jgi:hypothetical protein
MRFAKQKIPWRHSLMSNDSYNTEELPEVPFDYGMVVKDGLFDRLYRPQLEYWNKRLRSLSDRNVACYAREDEAFNLDDQSFVAIFFEGDTFSLLPLDEDEDPISPYCLELFTGDKDLVDEFIVAAGEIQKLKRERYESQRFLAGLMMFDPPPAKLESVLGDGLGRICQNVLRDRGWNSAEMQWDPHEPAELETFLDEQQGIITAMQERMLLNMITI